MASNDDWRRAYARQARADLDTRQILCENSSTPICHRLQFLQMACEKLVKSHVFTGDMVPKDTLVSHAVIAKHLPSIINIYHREQSGRNLPKHYFQRIRALARDIELLAPAVDDAGRQPSNCEYPWQETATEQIYCPADYAFAHINLGKDPVGRMILKILPVAIDALTV